MALTPSNPQSDADKRAQREASQQGALMREVDEAVRQDQLSNFMLRYGKPLAGLVLAGLLAFGGWLWWFESRESTFEEGSEELIKAIDQLDAGNLDTGAQSLSRLEQDGGPGAVAIAKLTRANIALREGRTAEAQRLFAGVAADTDTPQAYRDLATVREVALGYDKMKPADVVTRLEPLAKPGSPFFGSAGELLGAAYLDQNKPDLAGPLFAKIAKDETVPDTLRSRARQLAGLLGVDAIDDVDKVLGELRTEGEAAAPAE